MIESATEIAATEYANQLRDADHAPEMPVLNGFGQVETVEVEATDGWPEDGCLTEDEIAERADLDAEADYSDLIGAYRAGE